MSAPRWLKAQETVGPVDSAWWALVDTAHEGIRVKVLGMDLAQQIVDGLNSAEEAGRAIAEPDGSISP